MDTKTHEWGSVLFRRSLCMVLLVMMGSCSGFSPALQSKGMIVSPTYLSRFSRGGSLSTLWYMGSDNKYHYFCHRVKMITRYRIPRTELEWRDEFPFGSRQWVFCSPQFDS